MADRFVIELDAEGSLQRQLARAIQQLARPTELLDAIGARMVANVELRFDTKTAPDGTRWLPLADSTKASYEKKYPNGVPGNLLERTRRMRNSLAFNAGADFVEWGFSVPYALPHETGSRRGLPRRQMLTDDPIAGTLSALDRQDILEELEAFLAGAIGSLD